MVVLGVVPAGGVLPVAGDKVLSKSQVNQAAAFAKTANASAGKFTETLKAEKPTKKMGKKRKVGTNSQHLHIVRKFDLSIIENF